MSGQKRLPIDDKRDEILNKVDDNHVVIVDGKTGSGKGTKLVQFLFECLGKYINFGRIRSGNPANKRLFARNQGCGWPYGKDVVGFHVRFNNKAREKRIIYVTEGILLNELLHDNLLSKYEVVIIDEAHERNINTVLLLGALKHILTKSTELSALSNGRKKIFF